jgi:hypothetical protein
MSAWDDLAAEAPSAEDWERGRTVSASQALVAAQPRPVAPPPSWGELTAGLPATQELLADPVRAAQVADDVEGLSAIEKLFGGWREIGWETAQAWKRGRAADRLAEIGYRQSVGRATAEEIAEAERLEALSAALAPRRQGFVSGMPAAVAESLPMMLGAAAEAGRETSVGATAGLVAGAVGGAVAGGVGAIPGAAGGLLTGAGIGLKTGTTVAMAKREKGLAYREYLTLPGVTHEQAAFASTIVGAANGVLEVLPLDLVLQVPGFKALLRGAGTRYVFRRILGSNTGRAAVARAAARLAGGMTVEGLTEAAQELATILGGEAIDETPGVSVDWGRVAEAGAKGAQAGGGMGAPGVAAGLSADAAEASRAKERAAFFTALGETAAGSKTFQNLPEVAQAHVEAIQARAGGAVEAVSAPAEKLLRLFQENEITLEQVARRMPAVARQLEEAAGNPGVEVSIPTAEFAVNVAPLKGYEQLVMDLRVGDELTLREAEQVEAEAKALAEQDAKAEAKPVEATPEQRVAGDVAAKLEAAGQDADTARTNAALWGAFSRVMAGRTGASDAWAFYGALGLQVEHEDIAAIPVEPGLQVAAQAPAKGGQARGYVTFPDSRSWFKVTLTGSANLSTFAHESGHVFLEVLRGYGEVNEAIGADLKVIQEWLGVPLVGEFTQDQLERFARGFEAYLREGRAPSSAVADVFQTFKSWLVLVYRVLRGLDVQLTDDVRAVMDRMLATQAEVAQARHDAGLVPAFESAEQAGMTEAEFRAYRERWDAAARAAETTVEKRSLAALRRTMGEERARVREEVEQEALAHPVFNLREFLRTGARLDGAVVDEAIQGRKLTKASVEGLANPREMRRLRFFIAKEETVDGMSDPVDGIDSADLAPYFLFDDAFQMVRALVETPRREAWIKAEVAKQMAEKYPDSALAAIAGMAAEEVRAADGLASGMIDEMVAARRQILRAVAGEQKKATRRIGELEEDLAKAGLERDEIEARRQESKRHAAEGWKIASRPVMQHAEVLKRAAKQRVAGMVEFEMRPENYRRAEAAAAKDFVKAIRKGEYQAAYDAKVLQLWNHLLAAETTKARSEVERIREYGASFDDVGTRRRIGKVDPTYLEAIDTIREGVRFKRESLKAVAKRYSLAKWISEREAAGDVVAPQLKELSELKSYKTMTLEELRGVEAALANIDAMARLKGKLLLSKEKRDLARTAQELAEHIRANLGTSAKPTPGDLTLREKSKEWLRSADADMKKVEFIARILDGGKTAGLAHSLIFQPLRDAQNARYQMQEQVHGALMKPFEDLSAERRVRYAKRVAFLYSPKAGKMVSLSRRNVLSIALNLGNDGNRERLLKGYGWTEADVLARLDQLLDDGDIAIVEHVWKTVDSLWAEIRDLSQRHVGLPPGRVEATPFTLGGRKLSGGYYPIVKSRRMSYLGQQLAEQGNAIWEANFFAPVVEHGFTKSRGKDMSPLELSLDVVPAHLDKVIHYLTHYEAVRGVDKLLQRGDVRDAITEGIGGEYYNTLRPWLENIVADGSLHEPLVWYERVFRHLRFGSSVVLLFGKIPTGVKQGLGLLTSGKEVKRRHMVSGIRKFLREGWGEVARESPEFKFIDKQLDRDARELFTSLESSFTELGGLKRKITEYGVVPIMLVQKSVNAITWYAAREQAIEEGHANPAAYADAIVSMTQTGGGAKDLAAIQRGGELRKLFTVMFSYRSVLYNQLTERTGKTGGRAALEHAARFWWLVFLPVVVEQLLMNGVGDDEDAEDVAKRLALEMALLPASTVPVVGDGLSAAVHGRAPRGAPWVETIYAAAVTAGKLAQGDDLGKSDARAVVNLVGATMQLPTSALWNYGLFIDQLLAGEIEEPVQDLLFRNPSKWE